MVAFVGGWWHHDLEPLVHGGQSKEFVPCGPFQIHSHRLLLSSACTR